MTPATMSPLPRNSPSVGDVAQTLADHLLGGVGGDAAEVLGRRLLLADDRPRQQGM
jgi:hypothetical protein